MTKLIISILLAVITLNLPATAKSEELARNVFEIPIYPGTALFRSDQSNLKKLQPPFATVVEVYRTKDGSSLKKNEVIGFYETTLKAKGWKDAISKRADGEPYLGLQLNVYEQPKDAPGIQLAGDFHLWVAPNDGMYTIYLEQWRNSSPDQKTIDLSNRIVETLKKTAAESNYGVDKATVWGWEEFYRNEYLIEMSHFTLSDKTAKNKSDIDMSWYVSIEMLTYKNASIAKKEVNKLNAMRSYSKVAAIDNIVIAFEDRARTHGEVINKILARIEQGEK
jgi:hypothetical protein